MSNTADTPQFVELGSFVQPYFEIHINAHLAEEKLRAKGLRDILLAIDEIGAFPTFIHELVHYFQFVGTAQMSIAGPCEPPMFTLVCATGWA